jgi:hypothetical protein
MLLSFSITILGAILGVRFAVFVLVPAMTFIFAIAGANSVLAGISLGPTIIDFTWFAAYLQIGYLGGAAVRVSVYESERGQTERSSLQRSLPRIQSRSR